MFRNIELLRFIFTMIIVTSHVPILLNMLPRYMPDSYRFDSWVLGVDFFFILSGFFFVYTKDKYQTITDFIIRKIKRLWPVMAFTVLLFFLLYFFGLPSYGKSVSDYVYPFFFLNNLGFNFSHMGPVWYVSVLFMVLLFYFVLFKVMKPMSAFMITGLLTFFGYIDLVNATNGKIYEISELACPFLNFGLLRGISGIGLGSLLGAAYIQYKPKIKQIKPGFFWTVSEVFVLGGFVYFLTQPSKIQDHFIFILLSVMLIGLFIMKKGKISLWADHAFSPVLGRYCYAIFLSHLFIFNLFLCTLWTNQNEFIVTHLGFALLFVYECVILFGVLIYHLLEKPQNRWVIQFGYARYYIGVLVVTIVLVSGIIWGIQRRPMVVGETYFFSNAQISVPVYGVQSRNWMGILSDSEKMRIQFKKKSEKLKAVFLTAPSRGKSQEVIVFVNNQPAARWIFKEGMGLSEREVMLPETENADILFQLEKPDAPMIFIKMQLVPVSVE